jgi:cysteine synthase A
MMTNACAFDRVTDAIGATPVVRLAVAADQADVWVRVEGGNPTGSYKDRMALAMIEEAERRGDLRPGMTVVEYTGGSTGSSLAFVCAVKGYRLRVVSSDAFAEEKLNTMRALGADLTVVPSDGSITRELIETVISTAEEYAAEPDTYYTNQLENRDQVSGYRGMGRELLAQVPMGIDAFCGAVGTAGMLMGVATQFRAAGASTRIVGLEPAESPLLTTGMSGEHHVEGIGIGFRPPLLDDDLVDEFRAVPEETARGTARRLASTAGIFAGWSSGLNVAAAFDIASELGPGHTVVTVACDSGLKYLDGRLYA